MDIATPLFLGKQVDLGPINHEIDPEIEARWTHDSSFMRMMYTDPMRPLSAFQVKKKYEEMEKKINEKNNLFHFRIRTHEEQRLVGFGELYWINWPNHGGFIQIGIGAAEDRRKGYGYEALRMMLRYAFSEINLYRLTAMIPEYNEAAIRLFEKAGFREEVRRRQALARDGRRWDALNLGLIVDEWKE